MNIRVAGIILLLSVFPPLAQAQSELDLLLKQPDFKPILKEHLKEFRKGDCPTVSIVSFSHKKDTLKIYLSSISYLSSLEEDLPASFQTIKNRPFLVYDGSEKLIKDKQHWFETVKAFIGKNVCDDLTSEQPGSKGIQVSCGYLYHPTIMLLTFWQGRLVKRKKILTG